MAAKRKPAHPVTMKNVDVDALLGEIAKEGSGEPIRIGFMSAISIIEHRLAILLGEIDALVFVERLSLQTTVREVLEKVRILIIGPDVSFEQALELTRGIRLISTTFPLVLLRNVEDVSHVREAARAGATAYVLYPFEPQTFCAQLKALISTTSFPRAHAAELMSPVETIRQDEKIGKVAGLFSKSALLGLPVVDDDGRMVGFIASKDVLIAYRLRGSSAAEIPISRFMTQRVASLTPESTLDTALDLFLRLGVHALPVLDDDRPVGILLRPAALRALIEGCAVRRVESIPKNIRK